MFHENRPFTVKLIYFNASAMLSLQYHKRSEFWKVVKRTPAVELVG